MSSLAKILTIIAFSSAIILPYFGSKYGLGLSSEKNIKIIQESKRYCPESVRDQNRNCPKTYRSSYYGRTFMGGGTGAGK